MGTLINKYIVESKVCSLLLAYTSRFLLWYSSYDMGTTILQGFLNNKVFQCIKLLGM